MKRPEFEPTLPQEIAALSAVSSAVETAAGPPGSTQQAFADAPFFAPPTVEGELGRFGKYRIQKLLGRGGMGAVYLAFDERLQRKVALKVMLPRAAANPTSKVRFLREARAAARISSDYVVNIYEADEIDGTPFIALQYLQGYPLDEYLKKKGLPSLPQAIRIGRETALGLVAAHELGLIHRDIKPGNVWLEAPNGRVKILDFGLAKPVTEADEKELTASGAVVGTPSYLSPEQGLGLTLDGRADLFSLGCMLYRLCTGRLPFERPGLMATMMAIINEAPPPVRELNPQIPEALAHLIHELLAKEASDRPASAAVVAERLAAMESGSAASGVSASGAQVVYVPIQVTVYPGDNSQSAFADLDEPDSVPAEGPLPEQKRPRGSFAWIAAGFALFMALGIGGVIIIIKNKDGTQTKIEVPEGSTVEVKKDGKTIAKVDSVVPKISPNATPDRRAAEYVLEIGGTIGINGGTENVKTVAELPREEFQLTAVNLRGNLRLSDVGMANFKDCTNLLELHLFGTPVTDAALANFRNCEKLTLLDLNNTQTSDAGIAHFKNCKHLAILHLYGTPVTDVGLNHFKGFQNLTVLDLNNTQVTDAGLANFKDCKNLTSLHLFSTKVTDEGLASFKDCKALMSLDLNDTQIGDAGLAHLKDCTELTQIYLSNAPVTDLGMSYLKDRKNLASLFLSGTRVSDAGLANFSASTKLAAIGLSDTKITDEGLANLSECRDLKVLNLDNTQIGDAGLRHIAACKNLAELYLRSTKVTDAGLLHFADCKDLTRVSIGSTTVGDGGMSHLKGCKQIAYLFLDNSQVSAAGLSHFRESKNLKFLHVRQTKITAADFEDLKKALPQCKIESDFGTYEPAEDRDRQAAEWLLERRAHFAYSGAMGYREVKSSETEPLPPGAVQLNSFKLEPKGFTNDADLARFRGLEHLDTIVLVNTDLSDAGLEHLAALPKLEKLYLTQTKITDPGLKLLGRARTLLVLHLNGTGITDVGLQHLRGLDRLAELQLYKTSATGVGVKSLAAALPACKILWDGDGREPKEPPK